MAGKDIPGLMGEGNYKAVVAALLEEAGLNYGALPKGLLKFHKYEEGSRTPLEEHLAEGAMYAAGKSGKVNVHFTVSTEHRELFKVLVAEKAGEFAKRYGVEYNITFQSRSPVPIRLLPIWTISLSAIMVNCFPSGWSWSID